MTSAPAFYQEARLSTSPSSSPILHINAAGNSALAVLGAGRKRTFDEISGLDEENYARKHLATEGSIFFRPKGKAPRSFLWRVLNDRQLLEVQCVDLVLEKKHSKAESWLTFHISFPAPIIPRGVALADSEEKDALDIFVLTTGNELYTITLKRDLLVRETAPADFDAATCVKKASPGQLSYKRPYRLFAISSSELIITLHEGSMVRLERQPGAGGSQWRETNFGERGLVGSFRGFIPGYKPQTVRYGDSELYADAIADLVKSPDGKYIWTYGLDHMLKAWNTETGKVAVPTDLLGEDENGEERKKHGRYMISAEQGSLLKLVTVPPASGKRSLQRKDDSIPYFLATYSPKDHRFNVLGVRSLFSSVEGDSIELQSTQPRAGLIPPIDELMDTNIWLLEDFAISPGPDWRQSEFWLRARSGTVSRTFTLQFDLLDEDGGAYDLEDYFKKGWSVVDASYGTVDELRSSVDFNGIEPASDSATTPSEKWLEFLFYPGRFSEASLETALHIYRKGRNLPSATGKGLNPTQEPLRERITNAVSAKILLRRLPNEQPDYDKYQIDLHGQWATFFSLLAHLHTRRHESIGFAFDGEERLAWTVCADFVAPVRASTSFEKLNLNGDALMLGSLHHIDPQVANRLFVNDEDLTRCQVLAVGRQLRRYLSGPSQDKLRREAILSSLDHVGELSSEDALQALDAHCNFSDEIGDDEFASLERAADEFSSFGSLTDDPFLAILEVLEDAPEAAGSDHGQILARYGRTMAVAILQETLHRAESVLLDLLALVVFMHCELEQAELSPDFRAHEVYEAILLRLKQTELRLWLCSHVRRESLHDSGKIHGLVTIYESLFAQDWRAEPDSNHVEYGFPELLTAWNKRWIFGLPLNSSADDISAHILADLLTRGDTDLALDFVKFLPESSWISYLKGRLYLSTGHYDLADPALQDAANDMAGIKNMRSPIISQKDASELFGQGIGFYYKHVTSLFEDAGVPTYTADFADRALNFLHDENDLDQSLADIDLRKSQQGRSVQRNVEDTMEEIRILKLVNARDSLFCSLFRALNQTGRFERAYHAIEEVRETKEQTNCLHELLKTCIERNAVAALLELDMQGDLAQEADATLLGLAKKNMASGLPSGPAYHQILFAFRTQQSNFRGAAAILYEHLERLRKSNKQAIRDPEDETLPQMYVLLINTLACCGDDQGWLLADPIDGVHAAGSKRKLVTLEDIRRDYTAELDRRSDIVQGRFPLVGGDEMDML